MTKPGNTQRKDADCSPMNTNFAVKNPTYTKEESDEGYGNP